METFQGKHLKIVLNHVIEGSMKSTLYSYSAEQSGPSTGEEVPIPLESLQRICNLIRTLFRYCKCCVCDVVSFSRHTTYSTPVNHNTHSSSCPN